MKTEVSFDQNWNMLHTIGRRIFRDDISTIKLSDSGYSYLVTLKNEKGLLAYDINNCHFYEES